MIHQTFFRHISQGWSVTTHRQPSQAMFLSAPGATLFTALRSFLVVRLAGQRADAAGDRRCATHIPIRRRTLA